MTAPLSEARLDEHRARVAAELSGHWAVAAHDDRTVTCACGDRVKADPQRLAMREHMADKVLALLAPELAEVDRLRAELAAWQSAQDAVMALAEDINELVPLARVAKAHAVGLLVARRHPAAPTA